MRRADLAIGLGLLVFAAVYFDQSFNIVRGFASDRLGPAFFPRMLAVALAVLAVALLVRAGSGRSDPTPLPAMRPMLFFVTLALLVAYGLALPSLGFVITTPLLLAAVIRLLGQREWAGVIGTALGATIALYAVFGRMLHVLLPMGPLK